MKGVLLIALMLVAVVKHYAPALLEVHYQGLIYHFPIIYIFLGLLVIAVLSWLLAYQWQSLKIFFLRWTLSRTKKELFYAQQKLSDTFFYFNFLDQQKKLDVFRELSQQSSVITSHSASIRILMQSLSQALIDRNQMQVTSLMKQLSRKMPASIFNILDGRVSIEQLKTFTDVETRVGALKKLPSFLWEQELLVQELLEASSSWTEIEQSLIIKKIDPLLITANNFNLLEKFVLNDPASWLVYFYEQHWHEMVERSLDLALFLIKLNVHMGFIGQAQQLVDRLPQSLVKGLLQNALNDPCLSNNQLLKLSQS